jgi:hypothetical protein
LASDDTSGLYSNNQIGFTGYPAISGPFDVGNTITLAGSGPLSLETVDLFGYAGGASTAPFPTVEVDLYAGTDPNTGTLLGSATANLIGNGWAPVILNFNGLPLATNTLTFIVSLPGNNGSYDGSFVNWQQFTAVTGGPTIGSGDGVMWYGTAPGNFILDTTFAEATGAQSNYLAVRLNTVPTPESGAVSLLVTMLTGLGGLVVAFRKKLA